MTKIENYFPKFGVNKINEIERLIFEISKIESSSTQELLLSIKGLKYESAKLQLLKRRYPQTFNKNAKPPLSSFYLPKHKINKDLIADTAPSEFAPAHIFYVKKAADSAVFCNVRNLFPYADTIEIESLKSFQKGKGFKPADYNNRLQNLFLTQEKHDFFKQCPCSVDAVRCGYGIMNIGMGCPYECSYCFLQGYQNIGGIVLPYNIDDYLRE
ncbi:MAG: hypothetical protein LBB93_05945, partial [Elusimicrobiota bacterium]|nr:hypothetical protein [Elusimicrobiota bacterium]